MNQLINAAFKTKKKRLGDRPRKGNTDILKEKGKNDKPCKDI